MENTTPNENSSNHVDANATDQDVASLPAFEHTRYSGAGVLIFAYKNNEDTGSPRAYVLTGQERKGAFDDFGGGRGKGERHPILTAAREFSEESIGIIRSYEEMKQILVDCTIFVYDSNIYQYWVKLPLDAAIPEKFLKAKTEVKGKQRMKWIEVERIRSAILEFKQRKPSKSSNSNFNPFKQPLTCDECVLRKLFIKKMLRAEDVGLLERLEKCEL